MAEQNYNILALQGHKEFTDEDYSTIFGMPIELAGTPEVNNWMAEKTYQDNLTHYKSIGLSDKEAASKAGQIKSQTLQQAKEIMAAKGLL